jgi:uncharacterized membrane protein (UPF0182 family)
MYVVALVALLTAGVILAVLGFKRESKRLLASGVTLAVATAAFFALLSFWGEMLWFYELGFARRFWTNVVAQLGVALAGAVVAGGLTWLVTRPARRHAPRARWVGLGVSAFGGAVWGAITWSVPLRWAMGVATGARDPVLGRDIGFYLFSLPFYEAVYWLLLLSAGVSLFVSASPVASRALADIDNAVARPPSEDPTSPKSIHRGVFTSLGALALVLAAGMLLAPYRLMYSRHGVVYGAGWTDVHVRLPACYVVAGSLAILALVLLVPPVTRVLGRRLPKRFRASPDARAGGIVGIPAAVVGTVWVVGLGVLPALSQWLVVQPNELSLEQRYLQHNIAFTREGFGLGRVEVQEFPVEGDFTQEIAHKNERTLSEVRIWDPRALDDVLEQFQELRLYYEVTNVDFDRYQLDGRYRQVMIAPREMESTNLPAESQTFVNRHFKYTHGYGLVMAPVSDFTSTGLPKLIVRDLPPVAEHPSVRILRPEIYYGELTNHYVVANSRAPEFDYPAGGSNVYVHYEGTGGVPLEGFWERLVYGWKVGGTRLLVSDYPKSDSRIMFRRNIVERVAAVAPFLELDYDPYAVVVDGRVKWILDAYTTSRYYPYSEPYDAGTARPSRPVKAKAGKAAEPTPPEERMPEHGSLDGVNYARNSVKAVVDAYDGTVSLYVFEPNDPVVRVWSRIYPGMFRTMDEMPPGLRAHVRYPEALLHAQGIVFSKYHMTDPVVFYNQEDLWIRATEKYYDEIKAVEPYYVMWQAPGSREVEFILMQPFTPKNRQVLIGFGPQQVDTKIDQSPDLSAQLTLWDQHGKRVIRGNVLAIPIAKTILYVEPIYIQAQTAAYPELRMVVLMHGDDMSYAPTFKQALEGLVTGTPSVVTTELQAASTPVEAIEQAHRAFTEYVRLTNAGQFAEAGKQLEILRDTLGRLKDGKPLPTR